MVQRQHELKKKKALTDQVYHYEQELEVHTIYYEENFANEFVAKDEQLTAKDEEVKMLEEEVTKVFEKFVDKVNNANVAVKEEFISRENIMSMLLANVQELSSQLAPRISN